MPITGRLDAWLAYALGNRSSVPVLARLALLWGLLAALSFAGVLAPTDGRIFDALLRLPPHRALDARVALVDVDDTDARAVAALGARLRALGAKRVVALPHGDADERGTADRCAPRLVQGIVRTVALRDRGGECAFARAAASAGARLPSVAEVSPDFSVLTSTALPRVAAARLADPAFARQAVDGRVVLLAPAARLRYITPLYPADGAVDAATLQALVVDALSKGDAVRWLPRGSDLLLALLVALVLRIALRRTRYRPMLLATLFSVVPFLLACLLLIRVAHVHVPATAGLLAIGAFALRALVRRNRTLGDALVELDHRLTGLVQQPLNRTFDAGPDLAWDQVNHFVTQFFDLPRSLMLALPPGDVHLRPASAHGATADDIVEKRRDYRRAPYSTALTRQRPTIPGRPYLRAQPGLIDFVAPLVAADELVGFWAFSITERPAADVERLLPEAARYAEELAKIILRSRTRPQIDEASRRLLPFAQVRARLLDSASRAREQLAAYRDVFSAVGHPIAVTDLLGRIQFANPRFEQLAAGVSMPLLAMSVHNMLEQLCGLDAEDAKELLRRLILRTADEDTELPVLGFDTPVDYVLRLHPIRRQLRGAAPVGSPFELLGLIVEISPAAASPDDAARMLRAATHQIHADGVLFDTALRALDRSGDFDGRDAVLDLLVKGRRDAQRTAHLLGAALAQSPGQPATLDLQQMLHRLRQGLLQAAGEKSVDIRIGGSGPKTVHARADTLRAALADALALLVDDAAPDTAVWVDVSTAPDGVSALVRMGGEGYGLPAQHVAEVMHGRPTAAAGPAASPLDRLAQSVHELDPGVVARVDATLGAGYTVELVVPQAPAANG